MRPTLLCASWSESTFATGGVGETVCLDDCRIYDAFTNQLSDAITFLDIKIFIRMIEQNDANIAAVILIDDTSTNVDKIFPCMSKEKIEIIWKKCILSTEFTALF